MKGMRIYGETLNRMINCEEETAILLILKVYHHTWCEAGGGAGRWSSITDGGICRDFPNMGKKNIVKEM